MGEKPDIDGGWAWVILAVSCLNVLMGSALSYVSGFFQELFLEQYKESVAYTAWVTALFSSLLQLAGPISSLVANYFSCRVSVMLGGALLSLGLALSSFANSINYLMVTFGIIAGLGMGLIYTPAIIIINYYFHNNRNVVNGVVLAAGGAGMFVAPLLIRYLLDVISWRETLMILAAVSAQLCICGAFMFPKHESCKYVGKRPVEKSCYVLKKAHRRDEEEVFLNSGLEDTNIVSVHDTMSMNSNGSIVFNSLRHLSIDQHSMSPQNLPVEYQKNNRFCQCKMLCNKPFLAFCLNIFLTNCMYGGIVIHYPLWFESQGGSKDEAVFAMSLVGPSVLVSRFLLGAFGNSGDVDYLSVYIGVRFIGGFFLIITALYGYSTFTSTSVMIVISTYIGGSDCLNAGLTIDCVGLDQLASALGVGAVCAGMGYLVMPPMLGWIVDLTGSYVYIMYISGAVVLAAGLVCLSMPLLNPKQSATIGYHPVKQNTITCEQEGRT